MSLVETCVGEGRFPRAVEIGQLFERLHLAPRPGITYDFETREDVRSPLCACPLTVLFFDLNPAVASEPAGTVKFNRVLEGVCAPARRLRGPHTALGWKQWSEGVARGFDGVAESVFSNELPAMAAGTATGKALRLWLRPDLPVTTGLTAAKGTE